MFIFTVWTEILVAAFHTNISICSKYNAIHCPVYYVDILQKAKIMKMPMKIHPTQHVQQVFMSYFMFYVFIPRNECLIVIIGCVTIRAEVDRYPTGL